MVRKFIKLATILRVCQRGFQGGKIETALTFDIERFHLKNKKKTKKNSDNNFRIGLTGGTALANGRLV